MAAVFVAYANSFSVPFLFDDQLAIVENPTLRHLWPPWVAFSPPGGSGLTVEGRPLLNFSFALNFAASGTAVGSYHLANTIIHALAALTLFGLLRRTLGPLMGETGATVAFWSALLWAVHPLQTESVTYVVQRTESLMGLFYLATLYFFRRGIDATAPAETRRWFTGAFVTCLLGMATKEVMVTAPLLVLLYDRVFVSASWRDVWRLRGRLHAALFATWLLLGFLVLGSGDRGGTIGTAAGVSWWQYALCQSRAVLHYARLALWPSPLIFDYGADFVTLGEVAPYAVLDFALLGLTAFAWRHRPALGFLGAWYFLILSPTSSVVGGTRQMLAEHRIYLSLAALAVLAVIGLHRWLGRRAGWLCGLLAAGLIGTTLSRNHDYRNELALYGDTVAKRPGNAHAHYNFGKALAEAGRLQEAIVHNQAAIRLHPTLIGAHNNLANALAAVGRGAESAASYEAVLRLKPDYAKAHFNLGNLRLAAGEKSVAYDHFRAAVAHDAQDVEARLNLGGVALELGRLDEAREHLTHVTRVRPESFEAHFGLGNCFLLQKNGPEAAREFEAVLRLRPDLTLARERLEMARAGR